MQFEKFIRFMRTVVVTFLSLLFLLAIITSSSGNTAQYLYDDLGRLSIVVDEDAGYAAYEYDAVGNLLSISSGTTQAAPPLLQGITPDVLLTNATNIAIITGQNLLTTREIVSDNPALIIRALSVTDTSIKIGITVPLDVSVGVAIITLKTLYGSAQVSVAITKITFSPGQLAIAPGQTGNITASASPSVGKDLTVTLKSSDSNIASVPSAIVIPASGSTTFTVNAVAEGIVNVNLAAADSLINAATIFVSNPFTPEPGENVTSSAKPVSVYIMPSTVVDVTPASLPVSVFIQPSTAADVTPASLPVSVYIMPSTVVDVTPTSLPISVFIQPAAAVEVTPAALPVSVYIEQSSALNTTTVSQPVSAIINPP